MPLFGRRRKTTYSGGDPNSVRLPARRAPAGALELSAEDTLTASGFPIFDESLVAAGFRVKHHDTEKMRRLIQPWQARAFAYYDRLGEIKYASQFYARMLSPLRLLVEKRDPASGEWNEVDASSDAVPVATLERVQDPGGGREALLSSYGRLSFLAGEGILLCSTDPETKLEQWEFLSTDELRIIGGTYMRYRAPSLNAEEYHEADDDVWEPIDEKHAVAYRLWRRHPRYSMLADSTMMGVLDLCEELLLLTLAVRARARSRLASAGILLVSDSIDYGPAEPVPDEDADEDPLLKDLTTAMMTPIQNEGSASAVVPLIVRVPDEVLKDGGGMKHIQLVDPTQLYPETGLRRECIERIAIGLDMPPEILLGMSDANHWTVWMIDEQTWKAHGQPVANQLVNDLNAAYFYPDLRAQNVENWMDYRIAYDASAIVNHPDRTKDAKDLYDREAIGKAALRDAGGFTEDDAMPRDELAERIGVKVRDASLAWDGIPSVKAGGIEPSPGQIVSADGTSSGEPGATTGADVEKQPPDGGDAPSPNEGLQGAAAMQRSWQVLGAADLAILRAREAAGNRLRSLAKRDAETFALLDGVAARDVAAVLGPERVRALGVSDVRELVRSAGELVLETLAIWGIGRNGTTGSARLIAEKIEDHAARTLFEERPQPIPPQFRAYVEGVLGGH